MSCCDYPAPKIDCLDIPTIWDTMNWLTEKLNGKPLALKAFLGLEDFLLMNDHNGYGSLSIAGYPFKVQYKNHFEFDFSVRIGDRDYDYEILINSDTGEMWSEHHAIVHDLFIVQADRMRS